MLRDASEPPTAAAVAQAVMERRKLDPGDGATLRWLVGMVGPALRQRENHGRAEGAAQSSRGLAWRLAVDTGGGGSCASPPAARPLLCRLLAAQPGHQEGDTWIALLLA